MPHTPCKLTACAGLGMVLTSTEQVAHPDPEHGMLPPQPILLVATSDGALRLFTFASQRRSAEGVTRPALSYDDAPRPLVPAAAAQVCGIYLLLEGKSWHEQRCHGLVLRH